MTRKLSNWSEPGEKPPMVGVWETCYSDFSCVYFQYWNGKFYGSCANSPQQAYDVRNFRSYRNLKLARFRGLADKLE